MSDLGRNSIILTIMTNENINKIKGLNKSLFPEN